MERKASNRLRHGHARKGRERSQVYKAWLSIKARCYNPNINHYHRYGGRGIKAYQPWMDSFEAFYAAVGDPPSSKHSIDRIDNDGHYEPGNVRWATQSEQRNNTSQNVVLEYDGMRMNLKQWAEHLGVSYAMLRMRKHRGYTVEQILEPIGKRKTVLYRGKYLTVRQLAAELGVSYEILRSRIRHNKPLY